MFRVKICGITNVEDAIAAVEAGADAIGLNFYEKSPRCVTPEMAREIRSAVGDRALSVGVFVNEAEEAIAEIVRIACLDGVQLHGDEPPALVASFAKAQVRGDFERLPHEGYFDFGAFFEISKPSEWLRVKAEMLKILEQGRAPSPPPFVIRAKRFDDQGVAAIRADLDLCVAEGGRPNCVLVDSATPGRYGGTGETISWLGLNDHRRWLGDVPLILAGGLTPENVADAIRIVRPVAVDVASGVESSPGKKDPFKVQDFVGIAEGCLRRRGEK